MPRTTTLPRSWRSTALALASCMPMLAIAQSESDRDVSQLDAISVTGSRIKRTEIEGPAPVTIISSEQIRREGFSNLYEALATLTEVTGTVPADINSGPTPNAQPLNLRNLGPGRTLLLMDGRRVADYPLPFEGQANFANFGNIPIGMVERIEVLASGGSAIYGSDAMAGVINIITKKNFNGDEIRVKGGTTAHGGGDWYELSWTGGRTGARWSATYGLQHTRKKPIFSGQRPGFDSNLTPAATSKPLLNDPWPWNYGLELIERRENPDNPGSWLGERITPPDDACQRFDDMYVHFYRGNEGNPPDFPGYSCVQHHDNSMWTFRNGANNVSGFGNMTVDISNDLQFWASAQVWDGEGESRQDGNPGFRLLLNNPFFDENTGQVYTARRLLTIPEAGGRTPFMYYTNERSWDLAAGLRGTLAERFDWDATIGRTEYKVDFSFPAVLQSAIDNYYLGPRLGINSDGLPIHRLDQDRFWNPMTTETFRQLTTHGHSRSRSWMNQAQFTLASSDLFQLPAGPVGFAAVVEIGSQGYQLSPDPLTIRFNPDSANDYLIQDPNWQYDQPGGNNQGGGSRKRYAIGVELKLPLLSTLELTTAARFDRYDDDSRQENNSTWNVGLEWRPVNRLLLRGAYNTTFRAPDMHYLFATSGTNRWILSDFSNCVARGRDPNCGSQDLYYGFNGSRTGNIDLKSETGKSWSLGLVLDITDNLSFSTDYWSMTIDNQVRDFGMADILDLENQCRHGRSHDPVGRLQVQPGSPACDDIIARVTRSAPGTNIGNIPDGNYPLGQILDVRSGPMNVAYRRVAGVDVTTRYRFSTANWGEFNFQLGYTNQLKTDEQRDETAPLVKNRDDQIRSFVRGSINWLYGAWNTTLFARRIGHVIGDSYGKCPPTLLGAMTTEECENAGISVGRLKAPIYTNLTVGYRVTNNAQVNLHVENLFDEYKYKDPWKLFFIYANERVFSRVGREVTAEFVYTF